MENLAFLHASVAFEDPSGEPKLRSLAEMGLAPNNPLVMGAAGIAMGVVVLANPSEAEALVQFGDVGDAVADVQSTLISNGYSPGGIDGVFGSGTESAVIAFQSANSLSADGVVGPSTASAMGLSGPEYGLGGGGGGGGGTGFITISTNGNPLTVRSGPGAGFAPVDALFNGTVIGYTDIVNGWYEIDGGGWVSGSWVSVGGSGGGGGVGGPDGGPDTVTVSTNGNPLTIRSGPGFGFAPIDSLANGATVGVVNSSGGWYEIAGGGWIASDWTVEGGSGGGGAAGGGGGSAGTLVVSTNGSELSARSGPGLGFAVVGGYSNGAVVDFFDYSAGWYETSVGWISESWVSEI